MANSNRGGITVCEILSRIEVENCHFAYILIVDSSKGTLNNVNVIRWKVGVTKGQLAAMDFSVQSTSRSTCRWGDLFAWLPPARYTRLARTVDIGRQAELARHTQRHAEKHVENWWREDVSSDGVCEHVRRRWNCDDLTFRWIHRCK